MAQVQRFKLDKAEWEWIKPHVMRDAVIVVHPELDLISACEAVALNRTAEIENWISNKLLSKVTLNQIKSWDLTPKKEFVFCIVQPFVLVQEPGSLTS